MSGPGLARTYSMSVVGIEGHLVDVETYAGAGLVAFTLVGLLDTSVREARDRVRAAFESCGLDVLDQRITVNLSPAGIPKSGSVFDLAIASSIALATGLVLPRAFEDSVIVGELALDGSIQPVRGVLPAVLSARSLGVRRVIVPSACAREAQLVSGIEVIAFEHLADMIAWGGGEAIKAPLSWAPGRAPPGLFCGGCLDPRHGGCSRPARSRCSHGSRRCGRTPRVSAGRARLWQNNARLAPSHNFARPGPGHRPGHHVPALCRRPRPDGHGSRHASSVPGTPPLGDDGCAHRWRLSHPHAGCGIAGPRWDSVPG